MDKHVWDPSVPWSRRRIKWIVIKSKVSRRCFKNEEKNKKGKRAAKRFKLRQAHATACGKAEAAKTHDEEG